MTALLSFPSSRSLAFFFFDYAVLLYTHIVQKKEEETKSERESERDVRTRRRKMRKYDLHHLFLDRFQCLGVLPPSSLSLFSSVVKDDLY